MLKLAWILTSHHSGIGKYSESLLNMLKNNFHIDSFVADIGFDINDLAKYDDLIYNFSNSKDSLLLYEAIKKYPGIVILHDKTYHHFFAYYYIEYLKNIDLYFKALEILYSKETSEMVKRNFENNNFIWETDSCVSFSMRELIYPYATAIVVHSKSYMDEIKNEFLGEIKYLPMPFYSSNNSNNSLSEKIKLKIKEKNNIPKDKLLFLSYGFISNNRGIIELLEIIGKNPFLKSKVFYIIAGNIHCSVKNKIIDITSKYKLFENVKILDFLSENELRKFIMLSDCCINIRTYNTEGASWSLLEQMHFGKPVIVLDKGFFSEFPDDVLIKIKDLEEIEVKLMELVTNFFKINNNFVIKCREYLSKNFVLDNFVIEFRKLLYENSINRKKRKIFIKFLNEIVNTNLEIFNNKSYKKIFYLLKEDISDIFMRSLKN